MNTSDLRWGSVDEWIRQDAALDIEAGELPRPALLSFVGDEAVSMIFARPVWPDDDVHPIIEMICFGLLLRPDKMLTTVGCNLRPANEAPEVGRAIGGRAIFIESARRLPPKRNSRSRRPRVVVDRPRLLPYALDDVGKVVWREPFEVPGTPKDGVGQMLRVALRNEFPPMDVMEVRDMLERYDAAGHLMAFAPGMAERYGLEDAMPDAP